MLKRSRDGRTASAHMQIQNTNIINKCVVSQFAFAALRKYENSISLDLGERKMHSPLCVKRLKSARIEVKRKITIPVVLQVKAIDIQCTDKFVFDNMVLFCRGLTQDAHL